MGVVLLGIAALNTAGLTGAMMQMIAHGLVAGALFQDSMGAMQLQ